jgi:hypothetical protein
MRKNPRRILSPQRLPFRHPGIRQKNNYLVHSCTLAGWLRCYWGASLALSLHPPHRVESKVLCKWEYLIAMCSAFSLSNSATVRGSAPAIVAREAT